MMGPDDVELFPRDAEVEALVQHDQNVARWLHIQGHVQRHR